MVGAYLVTPGSKDFMLCMATPDGIDAETMRPLTQARFQCDADLAGNLDNSHSTSALIGYIGLSVVSFTSKTQGSLSTSTAESEIKAVNQCLKEEALALRGKSYGISPRCHNHRGG